MEVIVEALGGLEKKLTVTIPAEQLQERVQQRLGEISIQSRVKGFRPGKAPLAMLKKRIGFSVHEEIAQEYIQKSLNRIFKEYELTPVMPLQIHITRIDPDQPLEFIAEFEEYPEITFSDFSELEVERWVPIITKDLVLHAMNGLQYRHAEWKEKTEPAENGDRLTIDFKGTIDGNPFDGGEATGLTLNLEKDALLPNFYEKLIGVTPGSEVTIETTFPEDHHDVSFVSKTAVFIVQVRSLASPLLPELDVEFFEEIGSQARTVEDFHEELTRFFRGAAEKASQKRLEEMLLEQLLQQYDVPLPKVLIEQEMHFLQEQDLKERKEKSLQLESNPKEMRAEAERSVKSVLLFRALIAHYNIEVNDQDILEYMHSDMGTYFNRETIQDWLTEDREIVKRMRTTLYQKKALARLLEEVTVLDKEVNYEDFA